MSGESGQASVEWVAAILAVALVAGALLTARPAVDGRTFAGALSHSFACAVAGGCDDGDDALARAYGVGDAELVRRHLQGLVFEPGERQLPIDWRACRAVRCAVAPDDADLDSHRTATGLPATVFTRLLRRGGRRYIEYWSYYPDSNTTWAGSDRIWKRSPIGRIGQLITGSKDYPGFHKDDWEGAIVRVEPDGRSSVRVTSHGHWQWCKRRSCVGRWGPATGWTRVSRGSHSGHVPDQRPGHGLRERTSSADAIRLVPLESIVKDGYRRLDSDISPPWEKDSYEKPESPAS